MTSSWTDNVINRRHLNQKARPIIIGRTNSTASICNPTLIYFFEQNQYLRMTTESRDTNTEANINPGLKFFVWRKAYTSAAQRVVDKVFEEGALNNAIRSNMQSNDVQVGRLYHISSDQLS